MITISATQLRNNLFSFLDKVLTGETIVIERNKKEVARLVSNKSTDWRKKMRIHPKIVVDPQEIVGPMEDVWEDYL